MALQQWDEASQKRIADAVRFVERLAKEQPPRGKRPRHPRSTGSCALGAPTGDIEFGEKGNLYVMEGASGQESIATPTVLVEAVNLTGRWIWGGTKCAYVPYAIAGSDVPFAVLQSDSASSITGDVQQVFSFHCTVENCEGLDGYYQPNTAQAAFWGCPPAVGDQVRLIHDRTTVHKWRVAQYIARTATCLECLWDGIWLEDLPGWVDTPTYPLALLVDKDTGCLRLVEYGECT